MQATDWGMPNPRPITGHVTRFCAKTRAIGLFMDVNQAKRTLRYALRKERSTEQSGVFFPEPATIGKAPTLTRGGRPSVRSRFFAPFLYLSCRLTQGEPLRRWGLPSAPV